MRGLTPVSSSATVATPMVSERLRSRLDERPSAVLDSGRRLDPARAETPLDALITSVPDLPALSSAVGIVLAETSSGSATANSVAHAILTDPGLSARVLRLANSAYYGLSREVERVNDAVTVLGFRTVRSLVLVAGTYPLLKRGLGGYRLDGEELWFFSGAVAVAASLVAQQTRAADPDTAYGCGLLHDIGRIALDESLGERLEGVMAKVAAGEDFPTAEREELGFDHAEVGARMARGWNLPKCYVAAMRWHHQPDDAPSLGSDEQGTADCVHIGAALALSLGHGLGVDGLNHSLAPGTVDRLRIDAETYDTLAIRFLEEHPKQARLLAAAA